MVCGVGSRGQAIYRFQFKAGSDKKVSLLKELQLVKKRY